MNAADRARDSYGSWSLAIACLREQRIRAGEYEPRNDIERQWTAEGPVEPNQLGSLIPSSPKGGD